MVASGCCLSPGVTHIFLNTLEQKSLFFIPKCMRSFCATEHNPFFIVLTSFKGMCLFLWDFSNALCIHAALQLRITSTAHDLTPTFNARNYSRKYFTEITLLRSFGRIIPVPFTYYPFLFLLPNQCLPAVSALSGNFHRDLKPEIQKEEGHLLNFLHLQHQLLWNKAKKHPG